MGALRFTLKNAVKSLFGVKFLANKEQDKFIWSRSQGVTFKSSLQDVINHMYAHSRNSQSGARF